MPCAALLQCLAANQMTGILHLASESISGCFSVERGEIVSARAGALQGEDAALILTALASGTFAFERTAEIGAAPILNVTRLLLESAWVRDELSRSSCAPQASDWVRIVDESRLDAESRAVLQRQGNEPFAIVELAALLGMGTLRCCAHVSRWSALGAVKVLRPTTAVRVVVGARDLSSAA